MSFLKTIEKNRQNFLQFNGQKYERFQQLISNTNVKKVINAIPLMLSVNDPKIPGYVEGKSPMGITHYTPDKDTVKYAESRFHKINLQIGSPAPFIEMLAVMGSVGTIAYNKQSDFDYWVCVDKKTVKQEELDNFQKKIDGIQSWAMSETDIEIHLFINDINSLRNNIYAEDEDEAFGSTIGATLKDEFYRSSIIIAGKIPFWWMVPRIGDNEYETLYRQLPAEVREEQFIDLGNLFSITKEDFLGAALFQLIKALGNPFKSILKIGVLEKYLFGSEGAYLLSQKIKLSIHRGDFDNKILDSYILMFEEVYDYYNEILEDRELLKILRQNLYLKINPQLTKYAGMKNSKNLPYKVTAMSKYILDWKWNAAEVKELDNFGNWDYNKIMQFWNQVKKFMLLCYQKIAKELPSLNLAQHISESDFKLLSRKIKTNFSSNEEEIDNYITFKDTPYESILYVEPINSGIKDVEWRLYKRDTSSKNTFQSTTLKTDGNIVKLLSWTTLNQIFDPTFTRLQIQSGYTRMNQNLILELCTEISNLFNKKDIPVKNEFYLNPAFTIKNMLIINFNQETADTINSIYYLYRTSWGQSFIHHYTDPDMLISVLGTVLTDGIRLRLNYDDYCAINTPEPFKKMYKHLDRLYRDAYGFIVTEAPKASLRFVTRMGGSFIAITRDGGRVIMSKQSNLLTLLASLTLSPKRKVDYNFYGDDPQIQLLKEIWDKKSPNTISLIYENKGDHVLIYVINEGGNIFNFIAKQDMREKALINMYEFLKNIIVLTNRDSLAGRINEDIEVYKLTQNKMGELSFSNESSFLKDLHLLKFHHNKSLAAIITRYQSKEFYYCVKSPEDATDFTPLGMLGEKIKSLKKPQNTVPFISAIEFNGLKKADLLLGTTIYLIIKYRLEAIISKSL